MTDLIIRIALSFAILTASFVTWMDVLAGVVK